MTAPPGVLLSFGSDLLVAVARKLRNDLTLKMGYVKASALLLLLGWLYSSVLMGLFREWWTNDAASHGLLIPPLVAAVVWLRRHTLARRAAVPDWRGLLVLLGAGLLLVAGSLAAELFLLRISLVVMIVGLVLTFWGLARLRALAFPLLLLLTMIPLPAIVFNKLATPLQLLASDIATTLAQWIGVAVHRDGNVIYLAQMTLGVAEACSGLHSLSALMVASLLVGLFYVRSRPGRLLLLVGSIPIAISVNVLRVAVTAILADYRPELALGFYHLFSGWALFLLGFGAIWLMAKGLEWSITSRHSAG